MEKKVNGIKEKILNRNNYWLLAFLLSAVAMFLAYLFQGVFSGKQLVMRGDLYESNFAFIKEFLRAIMEGQNPLFSYRFGLGINNSLGIAHNALSPFNILYLILWNVDENIVTLIVILLKVGTAGAAFQFFCRKVLSNNTIYSVVISVFYGLCAYSAAYGTTLIMWLDAIILLPLLIIALVRCLKEKKRAFLIIIYALMFVTQFYLSFMVGVFSLLFVVLYLVFAAEYEDGKSKVKQFLTKWMDWAFCVVIAIMLSAVVWAPTLFFILANRVEDSTQTVAFQTTILEILNSLYWGEAQGIYGYYSYIYCGIPALALAPFYFIQNKINKKEKLITGLLLGFFLLCTIMPPLNSLLHAFDQPDSFWYRYSFIISFLLCAMAVKTLNAMDEIRGRSLVFVILGLTFFYELMQELSSLNKMAEALSKVNFKQNSAMGLGINLAFLGGWTLLFFLYLKKEKLRTLTAVLASVLVVIETASNAYVIIPKGNLEGKEYYAWRETMNQAVPDILSKDDGFYRVVCTNSLNWIAGAWLGFNGISNFGDIEKYSTRNFLSNMGFASAVRTVTDTGYTPVSNMLLGVKYNVYCKNPFLEGPFPEEVNDRNYATNPYALSVGYLVDGNTIYYDYPGRNVFENMNLLVSVMTGNEEECFKKVEEERISYVADSVRYNLDNANRNCYLERIGAEGFLDINVEGEPGEAIYMQPESAKSSFVLYDWVVAVTQNAGLCENVGTSQSSASRFRYDEGNKNYNLMLYSRDDVAAASTQFERLNVYELDEEVLKEQYNELSKEQLIVTKWKNGHIEGMVDVKGTRRLMFVSIPYDPGWNVKVDGKEVNVVRLIDGTFLGFFLPGTGEHTVELDYEVPGFRVGLLVSLCGIIAFLSVVFEKRIKEAQKKNVKAEAKKKQASKKEEDA